MELLSAETTKTEDKHIVEGGQGSILAMLNGIHWLDRHGERSSQAGGHESGILMNPYKQDMDWESE